MSNFSQSLVAVTGFASNVLFWLKSGYFDSDAELNPLLHTWSLAVEEQYYVFFPIFLIFASRMRQWWALLLLGVMTLVSLVVAQWGLADDPTATFYFLPSRYWELLIGAFVAYYLAAGNRSTVGSKLCQFGSLAGFALIVYAIFAFDRDSPFPGVYALIPTLGAALIILFSTPQTLVGKFLGSAVAVGLGLISYNAYLWHQPLFAFARHKIAKPGQLELGLLAVVALVLGTLGGSTLRRRSEIDRASSVDTSSLAVLLEVFSLQWWDCLAMPATALISGLPASRRQFLYSVNMIIQKCTETTVVS